MNKRLKELRIALKMNQETFGKLLGITKSGVSDIESGRRKVTEQHIIMLKSQKPELNEDWLRNGTGPMFVQPDTFSLDAFVKEHDMSELELQIMKRYFNLDPKVRKAALAFFLNGLEDEEKETLSKTEMAELIDECPKSPATMDSSYPPQPKPKIS